MATTLKVLGQAKPGAAGWVTLYTVPPVTQTVVSSFVATNVSTTDGGNVQDSASARIRVGGAAGAVQQMIADHLVVLQGDMSSLPLFTLGAGDIVEVWATAGHIAFSLFGSENS